MILRALAYLLGWGVASALVPLVIAMTVDFVYATDVVFSGLMSGAFGLVALAIVVINVEGGCDCEDDDE